MVLGAWESLALGEGTNGGAQSAKDTRAGQIGLEQHDPTSPRATACRPKGLRARGYDRRTGCGKTARPGPCRGRRVTGIPTTRGFNE